MSEKVVTISSQFFMEVEDIWNTDYSHKEWKIVRCIKDEWSWRHFGYRYQMKIKKLSSEEMESPLYKLHDGDIMKALTECVGVGAKIYKMILDNKKEKQAKLKSQQP